MESTPCADDKVADIVELRRLHDEMDRAVLRAFGWDDLAQSAKAQFLTEEHEDDPKCKGRLFWPAEFRAEVLSRLLALNAARYAAEEEALGRRERGRHPRQGSRTGIRRSCCSGDRLVGSRTAQRRLGSVRMEA